MLLQLTPEQTSVMWDLVKYAAQQANNIGPDRAQIFLNNLLKNILSGLVQVWVSLDEKREIEAIIITSINEDNVSNVKYLTLHSVYGFKPLALDNINNAMRTFETFAKNNNCWKVVVMTTDKRLLALYKRVGYENEVYVYSKDI